MIQPLQFIDTFALAKIFTPAAHYVQRKLWRTSYELSRFFCELTSAFVVLSAGYYVFVIQKELTFLFAVSFLVALLVSVVYYYIATQLSVHLQRRDAWTQEPLIAVRLYASLDWYFPLCFILAVLALTEIPWLFVESATRTVADELVDTGTILLPNTEGSILLYQVLHICRDVCEVSALYLLRVRPLPPSTHEEKRKEGFNPI